MRSRFLLLWIIFIMFPACSSPGELIYLYPDTAPGTGDAVAPKLDSGPDAVATLDGLLGPDSKTNPDVAATLDSLVKPDSTAMPDKSAAPDKAVAADMPQKPDSTIILPGLLLHDPLTGAAKVKGEQGKWIQGGKFVPGGWQTTSGKSQIMIQAAVALQNPGSLQVDVTNFHPTSQVSGPKHEVINLYSQKNGSKAIFNTKGSWWNIRTGTGYLPDPMDIKFLSSVNGTRTETRLKKAVTWDKTKKYTFSVTWGVGGITISLDGQQIVKHPWSSMVESFQYIFIGTNNVYTAQVGPIYSNLRYYKK